MDRKTKTILRLFDAADWKKEERYIRSQHFCGWKLTGISRWGFYRFESCESENYFYRVDYNSEGKESKEQYVKKFEDNGWEYLLDFDGYSYFRKPLAEINEREEELICEDRARAEFIRKKLNWQALPMIIITVCEFMPKVFHFNRPTDFLCYIMLLILGRCFYLCLALSIKFYASYRKLLKNIKNSYED